MWTQGEYSTYSTETTGKAEWVYLGKLKTSKHNKWWEYRRYKGLEQEGFLSNLREKGRQQKVLNYKSTQHNLTYDLKG